MLIHAGVLCNSYCPEELVLGELTSNDWHLGVKISIVVLIVGVAVVSVIIKVMFVIWLYVLERKLNNYLHSLYKRAASSNRAQLPVIILHNGVLMLCTIHITLINCT